jgi:hypothetical protein
MPDTEGLYRTVITVEVLSNGPFIFSGINGLADLAYNVTEGDCSGHAEVTSSQEVTPKEMAKLLEAQGSDPSFLLGEDWE